MNAPAPRTRAGIADRDRWRSWHADCEVEPSFACFEEADFVRRQHGGHGAGCVRFAAAIAWIDGQTDDDYE
ncbi:hypothetical protein [Nocardia carnea]|uniref:hypothetical protein n=1 Tax=Nocardia carnea TaxID=37328 RepID=UPI002455EB44|nr:hypothetical protein [Nocardia carnea]